MDPTCLLNLQLTKENLFARNLELSAGVFNLLGANFSYLQAYQGSPPHSPVPGHPREYVARASYKIEL